MASYNGPIVDVDVHHKWHPSEIAEWYPKRWRDFVAADPERVTPPSNFLFVASNGAHRMESYEPGFTRKTEYEILRTTFLETHPFYRILLSFNVGQFGSHINPEFAVASARAVNDWNIETWLGMGDDRLYSLIVVPSGHPEEAAKEIRRVGGHDRLVGVLLAGNVLGRPYGDPIYDPIYRAASELGLGVYLHIGTGDSTWGVTAAGGHFANGAVMGSGIAQQAMGYVSSYITNGTFEKFPDLKVLAAEYGINWLPWLLTRLDNNYEILKRESSWVKRWPSEYFRDHIKLSTQPLEPGVKRNQLRELLEMIEGVEDLLCFSTDYPHFTADDPRYVMRYLPKEWHRKVFCENACDVFGWEAPPEDWKPQPSGVATAATN
jgi:predicted TIM-barrel fold metal-dependent hydrolase